MRPRIVINTRALIASVLTRISVRLGLDPVGWADVELEEFLAKVERLEAN